MKIKIFDSATALGEAAAIQAAALLQTAIAQNGRARLVAATGASQFTFLASLIADHAVEWDKVELFHLDEYIGLPITHPASFRKYLLERLIEPAGIRHHHLLDGESNPQQVCHEIGALLAARPIDVAFVGIGENGHIAFNDPPANFATEEPFIVVDLDQACRHQQVGEGWFATLADVPTQAISMSVRQILKAHEIICVVPDARKANAVQACLAGLVTPQAPASVLQTHPRTTVYLDRESSRLLA